MFLSLRRMARKPIGVKSTNLSSKLYELPKVCHCKYKLYRILMILISSLAMQKHLKAGGKVSDLPPPPPSDTSKKTRNNLLFFS